MSRLARAELDAAGITDPALRSAYRRCRSLNARHGRTYFLATRLLPAERRPAVHALYGFARWADDIVDLPTAPPGPRLDALAADVQAALAGAPTVEPVLAALADTVHRYDIAPALFDDFMASMRMDLHVTDYATFDDLGRYMRGSAAAIGLQMLPVLGTSGPPAEAREAAAALGIAFQLTNFLRDVGEDLDRGRVYLPAAELAAFGVDRALLTWCRRTGNGDARVRAALAHLHTHTRDVYRSARPGIAMLDVRSQPCVACAYVLYQGILDEIAAGGHDVVLRRRVAVPRARRAAVAARAALMAWRARPPR